MTAERVPVRLESAPVGPKAATAPRHLSPAQRSFWRSVVSEYQLESHHYELLKLVCQALDRAEEARAILAAEGLTIEGRFGARAHPAAAIERDAAVRAARLLRELGLDLAPPASRPPSRWR